MKGALAKGTLQHGSQISSEVSPVMASRVGYKQHLLFGMPMIQAFNAEKNAPPFGIYIHESARTVKGLQGRYFFWRRDEAISENADLLTQLKEALLEFLKRENDIIILSLIHLNLLNTNSVFESILL